MLHFGWVHCAKYIIAISILTKAVHNNMDSRLSSCAIQISSYEYRRSRGYWSKVEGPESELHEFAAKKRNKNYPSSALVNIAWTARCVILVCFSLWISCLILFLGGTARVGGTALLNWSFAYSVIRVTIQLDGQDQQHSLGKVAGVLGVLVWQDVKVLHLASTPVSVHLAPSR